MTALFRSRTRLGSRDLTHVEHVLGHLDAQHVAVVHGEHGVVTGLDLTRGDNGRQLFVAAGAAYSVCGELVCVPRRLALSPPLQSGLYTIWLQNDGRLIARPSVWGRVGDGIRLGEAVVEHRKEGTLWGDPIGERPEVHHPNPPFVAAGSVAVGQLDVAFETEDVERRLSAVIETRGGEFERTPLYFATVGAINRGETTVGAPLAGIAGWFGTIHDPTPTQFTLQVQVHAEDFLWQVITQGAYPQVSVEVSWIGVLPRRPGVRAIDPTSNAVGHITRSQSTTQHSPEETIR